MSSKFRGIRGVHDGLPADVRCWKHIEQTACLIFERFGFSEVRLPVLEPASLFVRSIGEETDIVSKEMYRFEDQGGDDICLRPEGTAGAVRAWLQAGLSRSGVQRWYYAGPMFRRERPQKGRLRQFQQIGVEMFATPGPAADADLVFMAQQLLDDLCAGQVRLEINSLGCPVCRPDYREQLVDYLQTKTGVLCQTCNDRIRKNPMRVLDCKVETCQQALVEAPEILSHLCRECDAHFTGLKEGLEALSVQYHVNPRIVRGLDYYNRTAFEFITDQLGAQGTVLAGGRYDGLVEALGGPRTPAIGFALGLERLALLLPAVESNWPDIAIVALGDSVTAYALNVAAKLRQAGCAVIHCGGGSAKRQFKVADREGVGFVVVIGEDEMRAGLLTLKNMQTGEQQKTSLDAAASLVLR